MAKSKTAQLVGDDVPLQSRVRSAEQTGLLRVDRPRQLSVCQRSLGEVSCVETKCSDTACYCTHDIAHSLLSSTSF